MAEWQPIETAPKDGERVLLFWPEFRYSNRGGDFRRIEAGRWETDRFAKRPRPYWSGDAERVFGVTTYRDHAPTGWQPLEFPDGVKAVPPAAINERHVRDAAASHGVVFVNRSYGLRSTDTIGLDTLTSIVLDVMRAAGVEGRKP